MVTQKQIGDALVNINHNTTAIKDSLVEHGRVQAVMQNQHKDMIGELRVTNEHWFKIVKYMIAGVFAIASALIGLRWGGVI